jgi:hypothetical protein
MQGGTTLWRLPVVLGAAASLGCGSGDDAASPPAYVQKAPHCVRGDDAGRVDARALDAGPADAPAYDLDEGPFPGVAALPQVLNLGGPTLDHATLVSVTYADDPLADEVEDFVASVGCSNYWSQTTAEYGIGEAVAGPPVRLAEAAPAMIDDSKISAWLVQKIESGDPQFAKPAPQTVYIVFFPETSVITEKAFQMTSCKDFGGYHYETQLSDGSPVAYAVIPRCPVEDAGRNPFGITSSPDQAHETQVASVTVPASHEIIESVTDPEPVSRPAYYTTDPNHFGWWVANLTEVADLCTAQGGAGIPPWYVEPIWSNRAAARGEYACVPRPYSDIVYAAPVLPDSQATIEGFVETVASVPIPVGGSATIPVRIVGTTPSSTEPIEVFARDGAYEKNGPAHLALSLHPTKGKPGDTLSLTITKMSEDSKLHAEPFVLIATGAGQNWYFWGATTD